MRAAAHENSNIYVQSYQSSESRVDGQNTFLGNERREDVSDAFLELSVPYTPNLAQRLPAEERYKLQRSQEYLEPYWRGWISTWRVWGAFWKSSTWYRDPRPSYCGRLIGPSCAGVSTAKALSSRSRWWIKCKKVVIKANTAITDAGSLQILQILITRKCSLPWIGLFMYILHFLLL